MTSFYPTSDDAYATMRFVSDSTHPAKGGFSLRKLASWLVLGVLLIVILLMLKKPAPVAEPMTPATARERSEQVQTKLLELENARQRGEPAEARFSSEEINGVFQQAQIEQQSSASSPATAKSAPSEPPNAAQQSTDTAEAVPEISTTRISFEGDHAVGQFVVHGPAGKEIYLTIAGKIKADHGYAGFEFTEGKIGDMPVPVALLNARLQDKLQEPETRPKLKLPEYVADIHVENGELVMREK